MNSLQDNCSHSETTPIETEVHREFTGGDGNVEIVEKVGTWGKNETKINIQPVLQKWEQGVLKDLGGCPSNHGLQVKDIVLDNNCEMDERMTIIPDKSLFPLLLGSVQTCLAGGDRCHEKYAILQVLQEVA